uniref:Sushi, von Willebrand factor type A, EGF and pentraxin domain-containing protein 1 n=1 Tax=Phallusia mammillata TaxID=59560 RepID=A0A6F9DTH0_9ASCI|nr:sushi, von Willebrand factor type A, EGF and pentraxin domain-containing protein 1 [Phallusia mammillata]
MCSCDENYQLQSDGKTCKLIVCPDLTPDPQRILVCTNAFSIGSVCLITCVAGYEPRDGASELTCSEDGSWDQEQATCQRVNCPSLRAPFNGQIICGDQFRYESICMSTCYEGYEMIGEEITTCSHDKTWTNAVPKCRKIQCPASQTSLRNGRASCNEGNFFQSVCRYFCNAGYKYVGIPANAFVIPIATCGSDAAWSSEAPTCEKVACDPAADIMGTQRPNGDITCTEGNFFESTCSITCPTGYDLIGPARTTCNHNRAWSQILGHCEKVKCPVRKAPRDGSIECTDGNIFGSTCVVTCEVGHDMIGQSMSRCQADRTWSERAPKCQRVTCDDSRMSIGHGEVTCTDESFYDSRCAASCNLGYEFDTETVLEFTRKARIARLMNATKGGAGNSITSKCMASAQWDINEPTCVKHSCIPTAEFLNATRPNGDVTCTDGELFQSLCTVTCDVGYELVDGGETTECGNRRQWLEQLGVCQRVQCPAFSDFRNGILQCNNHFSYESVCEFTCVPGYDLVGESTSTCQADRTFSNPQPHCEKIQCPSSHLNLENGRATCSDGLRFESQCVYVCDPGYEMTSSPDADTEDSDDVMVMTCRADRTWSGELPYCKRKQCSQHDGALTKAKLNGDVVCSESAWYGSQCSVTCHAGYRLIGPDTTRCTASADWAPTLGYCEKIECGPLTAPSNGEMECSDSFRFESTCTVTCNRGYERIGTPSVSCQADKTYSDELPTCKEIICPMSFTTLENGQATCSNTNKFDSVCTYRCDAGYEMTSGSVAKATCQVTYSWDAQDEPMCVKKLCSHSDPVLLQALKNGIVHCTDEVRFESECTLTCNEGYELTDGIGETTCLANQNWDDNFGFCQKILCPAFSALENGQVTCDDANRYMSVCSFGCDAGYELKGESTSTCQADRTFTVELPACHKTECHSAHLSIENGATECTESNLFESVCEYVCDAGYEITAGSARAQCQDDQTWDKAKATCEKKICPSDNQDFTRADRNGVITCTEGHVFDSVCSLECDAGYRLIDGTSDRTRCNENAEWEPTLGYCVKIACEAYDSLTNGGMECSEENLFLSICEFRCNSGYEMEGSSSSVCQANKSWTAPMPDCYKISCPRSYLELENGETDCTESNRFGSVCSYSCDSGYEMAKQDINSSLCTETKTWSSSKPTCSKKKCPRNDPSLLKADMIGNVTCTDGNLYQSNCSVTCPQGYELIGGPNSVTCLASATWNAEIGSCQRVHCEALERPANSALSCSNSNLFESVCEFECDAGYILVGEANTTCQADRTFSNEAPHCNKITCAIDYTSIDHGTVLCSEENLFESVCAYQCDIGYRFFNNDVIADDIMTATCLADASWTNEVPICEKVTCNHDDEDFVEAHETGNVTCTEGNRYGSTCTVTCDKGSDVIGYESTTCTNTGMWNASLGRCEIIECQQLTEPFFGNLTCSNGYRFNSRCEYTCQAGYEFTSESWDMVITEQSGAEESQKTISALCKADETWTISGSPECERKACPIEGWNSMENGFVACSDSNLYLSQCLFQCIAGYEVVVPQDQHDVTSVLVTCTSEGQWSVKQPPACKRQQCQQNETELQNLEPHGRVTCTNGAFYDSECSLKCNKGYHLASDFNTTRCENNREWSVVLATCEKNRCKPLADPANGMLTCTDEHYFKSHCYLKCEAGYQIVDPEDEYDVTGGITCRSDGTWCGDVPRCEKIQCPKEQTRVINGDVICSDFNFYESQCTYACDAGYHMIQGQSSVSECLATGQWSELAPMCQHNRCPANETSLIEAQERGDVTCTSENQFGSVCMLKCYDGYQMTGEPSTACMHTGEWSNGLGLCQRISCAALEANDRSTLECTDQFRYQSVCLTACEAGYERVTSSGSLDDVTYDVKCEADGQWVGTLPECQKKTCKWPGYNSIANGHVQCTEHNSYGSACIYICLPGYEMQHSTGADTTVAIANCTVNGTWNIYPPMCVPSQCSPTVRQMKESVENGNVTCTNGSAFGSKCTVKCECGYQKSSDGSTETECQRNGNWWPPMARCEKIQCPAPEVPAYTHIQCSNENAFDSTCSSVSCDPGYMLTTEDDGIITCAGEGHWLGVLPPCKKRECSASFLDLENGLMVCSDSNNYASTCEYSCNPGFVLVADRQEAHCLASGQWSVEAVVCTKRVSCQSTYFAFGSVECSRDGRCQLSCDVGTNLIGPGESTCRDDTPGVVQWEPELGVCKKRSCESLSAPPRGSVTCSDHMRFRSSCRFRCDEGFRVAGEMTLKCRADGSWSNEVPQCVERTCNPSYLTIENGIVVTSNSVNNGSIAEVTCEEGFELIGSSEITCLPSGVWNKAKPSCQRLTCPPLNLDNGKVECGQDSHQEQGVKCNFRCNSMYELVGDASATCRPDGSWSNTTPYCKGYCDQAFANSPSGRVNCSNSYYHRSQCRFWCDSDSDVTKQLYGSSLVTCQEDGRWSETPPCCARECPEHAKMDLYFVLDSSSTEGFQNWTKVLEFVNTFLSQLSIGDQDTLVGVVRYNRDVDVKGELPLGKYQTLSELQHAVTFLPYGGHGTNTGRALTYVAENSFASPSNRPDAHDYVILITDDVSDDEVTQAAQTLTQNMITTYTIGIGDVNSEQLQTIAEKPEYVHLVGSNYEGLNQELVNSITSSLCDNPCLMQNSWRNIASEYLTSSEG